MFRNHHQAVMLTTIIALNHFRCAQVCVPPRAPAVCVSLAARVRLEPLYIAGRYLKLQRCVMRCAALAPHA